MGSFSLNKTIMHDRDRIFYCSLFYLCYYYSKKHDPSASEPATPCETVNINATLVSHGTKPNTQGITMYAIADDNRPGATEALLNIESLITKAHTERTRQDCNSIKAAIRSFFKTDSAALEHIIQMAVDHCYMEVVHMVRFYHQPRKRCYGRSSSTSYSRYLSKQ